MTCKSVTEQLRESLFDTIEKLKDGKIDANTAQAVSKISSNILNTVALEMRAAESFGTDSVYSINGHTAEQRRELEGGVRHRLK